MMKSSRSLEAGAAAQGPWFQMGQRLRSRRVQLGFRKGALAAHLGVSMACFEQMEAGAVEISPALLGKLSDLLKVPVIYFFQDMVPQAPDVTESEPQAEPAEPATTDEERLVNAFRSLDPESRKYLLTVARALAREPANRPTTAA